MDLMNSLRESNSKGKSKIRNGVLTGALGLGMLMLQGCGPTERNDTQNASMDDYHKSLNPIVEKYVQGEKAEIEEFYTDNKYIKDSNQLKAVISLTQDFACEYATIAELAAKSNNKTLSEIAIMNEVLSGIDVAEDVIMYNSIPGEGVTPNIGSIEKGLAKELNAVLKDDGLLNKDGAQIYVTFDYLYKNGKPYRMVNASPTSANAEIGTSTPKTDGSEK